MSPMAHAHARRMPELIERSYADRITLQVLAAELDRQDVLPLCRLPPRHGIVCRPVSNANRSRRASAFIRDGVTIEAVALLVAYRSKTHFYRQFDAAVRNDTVRVRGARTQRPTPHSRN